MPTRDDAFHYYDPARGHGLPHDPFKAIVAPRPIGWISTVDAAGRINLAPYSFFNAVCDHPPMVAFASVGWKDTIANIEQTREFVCNLATRPLADAMNRTSAPVPHEVCEFTLAGLDAAPCRQVKAPRVAASPAALECRLVHLHRLEDVDGQALDRWLAVGQVVGVHIDRRYLTDGLFDLGAAQPILRAGYAADYVAVTPDTFFQMTRPAR